MTLVADSKSFGSWCDSRNAMFDAFRPHKNLAICRDATKFWVIAFHDCLLENIPGFHKVKEFDTLAEARDYILKA